MRSTAVAAAREALLDLLRQPACGLLGPREHRCRDVVAAGVEGVPEAPEVLREWEGV